MKKRLPALACLLAAVLGSTITGMAQTATQAEATKKMFDKLEWKARTYNYLGAEAAQIKLRLGYQSMGLWTGYHADIAGVGSIGAMWGQASYQDSSGTVHMDGTHIYGGAQICYSLFRNQVFDIYPFWGVGIQYNRMQNGRLYHQQNEDHRIETAGLGGYASVGMGVLLGPVSVKAKLTGMVTANFNRANAIQPHQYYASVTVGIKPLKLLLNPYMFTADGLHYKSEITDVKTTRSYVNSTTDQITTTYNVKTSFQEGSVTVMDVRPYWFAGPTYSGTLDPTRPYHNGRMIGVVGGFRYGGLYMDGSFAMGALPFNDVVKRDGFLSPSDNHYAAPRLDGYFDRSMRYGGRIGVDMVTWFAKSSFIPHGSAEARRLKRATSYYAFIVNGGYGVMNLGRAVFVNPGSQAYYSDYIQKAMDGKEDVLQRQGQRMPYLSFGAMFILGAVSADYNVYFIQPNGEKTYRLNRELSLSWKIPVVRLFRIGSVMRLEKANRERQNR